MSVSNGFNTPRGKSMAASILVIDDELPLLELYKMMLEPEGYEVSVSEKVFEDVVEVERLHPDLIILDLKMGKEQQGWDLLQALKSFPATSSIPVLISSAAHNEIREKQDYLKKMRIPIVLKPFDVEDFLQTVHQVLPLENKQL
jgi:two-component system phosphate regulon response regulator PhoB